METYTITYNQIKIVCRQVFESSTNGDLLDTCDSSSSMHVHVRDFRLVYLMLVVDLLIGKFYVVPISENSFYAYRFIVRILITLAIK